MYTHKFNTESDRNTYILSSGFTEPFLSTHGGGVVSYNSNAEAMIPMHKEHEYVEIGGIKWATMNVGATSITGYGLYFQWADTSGYTRSQVGEDKTFNWANYKYCDGTSSNMTKYNSSDGLTRLELFDDGVRAAWGGNWRLASSEDFANLGSAVNTALTSNYEGSGVAGLVVTDKTDSSKVLFFPAAGYAQDGFVASTGTYGNYWTSSLNNDNTIQGKSVDFRFSNSTVLWVRNDERFYGMPLRGVVGE